MPFQPRSYDLAEIAQWAINTGRKIGWNIGRAPVAPQKMDEDPLLNGETSEGLERYRMARAQREEMKLAEERGEVVTTEGFFDCARVILSPLRRLAETFKRQQNHDAFSLVEEATTEIERGLNQLHAADGD
jgi:phage terminase Nu1 subunit (DNA packaging protein)